MNAEKPQKQGTENVLDFVAERAKREQKAAEALQGNERLADISLQIRSAAAPRRAFRDDLLKWREREAAAGNLEQDGELDTSEAGVLHAVRDTLEYELGLAKNYTPQQVEHFLTTYANPAERDTYPLMRYYAAAHRFEELIGSKA